MTELGTPGDWAELAPLLRRALGLDPAAAVRLVAGSGTRTAWVQLPFGVLAARAVHAEEAADVDLATSAQAALNWVDAGAGAPPRTDLLWQGSLPPRTGWQRLDRVPDAAIRDVVRTGAREIKALGGTAPRTEQALLDAVVLTVADGARHAEISLRAAAALTRMGFLPRESEAAVDVAGRWTRLAALYGSIYAERSGAALRVV
jgi:hypothetical protein